MGKVRIYELAKELNMNNKEVVEKLQEMGFPVKSHSSTLEPHQFQEAKDRLLGRKSEVVTEDRVRPTVIRRRKKVVEVPQEAESAVEAVQSETAAPVEAEPMEVEPVIPAEAPAAAPVEAQALAQAEIEPEPEAAATTVSEAAEAAPAEPPKAVAPEEPEKEAPAEAAAAQEPGVEAPEEAAAEELETTELAAAGPEVQPVEGPTDQVAETAAPAEREKARAPEKRPPAPKASPKIKRIKKPKDEPARIISRPAPTPPPKPEKPRPEPIPLKPAPERPARPEPRVLRPEPPVATTPPPPPDDKKPKKKKKSREVSAHEDEAERGKALRRREIIEGAQLYDTVETGWAGRTRKAARPVKKLKKTEITVPKAIKRRIKMVDAITVTDLAKKMGVKGTEVVRKLMSLGLMAHLNQAIDFEAAALVASEFGYEVEKGAFDEGDFIHIEEGATTPKEIRPPVVTVMGHVDHGKTSLLDAIRKTNVIEGEAGSITQHIGAYHVITNGGRVTFLDTPGHEAFTAMRARGAQVTDIVVLVVAADDGVMQQTREAIDHAKAAKVPIIVAVNKIDKPESNPDRIRREMADLGLIPEAWGGETIFVDVSAKTGQGIDELLDYILLQAEVLELTAAPDGRARGRVIEARLDRGRGPVATVLIQGGLLKAGDACVCGVYHGKVRAMFNDWGQRVDGAGPAMPVEIQGISGVPQAGDEFVVLGDDRQAKQVSQHRQLKQRESELLQTSKVTLETLYDSIKEGATKELNLVLKADVQGSLEAISDALAKLSTQEIKVNIIHSSTGSISDNDIMLASASNALVVGFNVRPNAKVQDLAGQEKVQVRFYDVIYKLIDEIKEAMVGMLEPIHEERVIGRAEVREAFHITKVGTIAGSSVIDGKVVRGARARLLRDDVVVYDGRIGSLKRFKEDAKEVVSGFECGIGLDNYNDIKAGDIVEAYVIEDIAATL